MLREKTGFCNGHRSNCDTQICSKCLDKLLATPIDEEQKVQKSIPIDEALKVAGIRPYVEGETCLEGHKLKSQDIVE